MGYPNIIQNIKSVETSTDLLSQDIIDAVKEASQGSCGTIDLQEPFIDNIYHELGSWWFSMDNTIPIGGLPHLGHLCSRATYGDFWIWCEGNKTILSEEEWLAYAESHNGCCPYYSSGDGSTTFRTPCYDQSFLKILATIGGTGEMEEAGLPNITGSQTSVTAYHTNGEGSSGALRVGTSVGNGYAGGDYGTYDLNFNASLSNPIYGNSDTVTPQNFGVIVGVYAVGAVSAPIGETDAANLLNGISVLETGKASVDLSNLSTAGRSLAAGMGMPSGRYIDLTLGANQARYIAPANGWFTFAKKANNSGELVGFVTDGTQLRSIVYSDWAGAWLSAFCPAMKGAQISVEYTATGDTQFFRFIYAEGEEA